jgi:hypothetical protein
VNVHASTLRGRTGHDATRIDRRAQLQLELALLASEPRIVVTGGLEPAYDIGGDSLNGRTIRLVLDLRQKVARAM